VPDESRLPVIVGTDQLVERDATVERHKEPLAMLTEVARGAIAGTRARLSIADRLDTVALVGVVGWHP
jgi:hypothetical protein